MSAVADSRPLFVRPAAIVASLLLHGLIFVGVGGSTSAPSHEPVKQLVTRMSFLAPAERPAPAPEKLQEQPRPVEPEKPKPSKRKKARYVAKPEQKIEKPLPEVTPHVQPQVAQAATEQVQQLNEGVIEQERERYLAEVMAHIEAHKWYPKAARRRGIEGVVNVRFVLHPDGTARQLNVENGPSLLVAAAKQAVEAAVPMPKPPANVHCPIECEFRMRFALDAT